MALRLGSGYKGSLSMEKSLTNNHQVIPNPPPSWSLNYNFYKFQFSNPSQSCTVKINNEEPIWLPIGKGFITDYMDAPIWSFIILEQNIDFHWAGAY